MTNEVRVISYIIGSDSDYYNLHHFTTFSVPTADTLFLLILSILGRTQRFQLSEWTLLCESHVMRTCLEWG